MSLRPEDPDWPDGALEILADLEISETLQVGEKADIGLGRDAPQLEAAEVLVPVEDVLGGGAGQQEVDQALTAVTVDRVDQTLLHVLPLRDDVVRSLGQHHGVQEGDHVILGSEYFTEVVLKVRLETLDAVEGLDSEEGVEGVDVDQSTAGVSHPLGVAVLLTVLQDLGHLPGDPGQHDHLAPAVAQDLHHGLQQEPGHGVGGEAGKVSDLLLQADLEDEGLERSEDSAGSAGLLEKGDWFLS